MNTVPEWRLFKAYRQGFHDGAVTGAAVSDAPEENIQAWFDALLHWYVEVSADEQTWSTPPPRLPDADQWGED